jgi:hypothetical protein
VQVAATTPQAAKRLLAIFPDVANHLAVIALDKGTSRVVGLDFDGYVTKCWDFAVLRKVIRYYWCFGRGATSG